MPAGVRNPTKLAERWTIPSWIEWPDNTSSHLTNYRLTGQSILYQLQTGWLVSIMILIVLIITIADQMAGMYCYNCKLSGQQLL